MGVDHQVAVETRQAVELGRQPTACGRSKPRVHAMLPRLADDKTKEINEAFESAKRALR